MKLVRAVSDSCERSGRVAIVRLTDGYIDHILRTLKSRAYVVRSAVSNFRNFTRKLNATEHVACENKIRRGFFSLF
jgi:hypothetical protein